MSINLLDLLKDQVSGSLAKQASSFLGESEENVTSGLSSIFPTLLGSIINKTSEPNGPLGVMDMISELDMDKLGDIGSLFGGGSNSVNGLLNSGGGIVESLLGDKMGGIVEMISKVSGLKSGSSSSLMKMAAPFLVGMIGKQVKGKGLSFLTDLLIGQKDNVQSALPSGLGSILGFSGLTKNISGAVEGLAGSAKNTASNIMHDATNIASEAAYKTGEIAKDSATTGLGWLKWLAPILIVGALLLWGINAGWFGGSAKNTVGNVTESVESAVDNATESVSEVTDAVGNAAEGTMAAASEMAKTAFSTIDEAAKEALDKVTFAANSAGSQIMDYINGGYNGEGKFTFNNLTFETGSAKINADSADEIDNLASILKAYPKVELQIDGHTDNQGDAAKNKTLSEARAMAVKGRLIAQGIAGDRITTSGFGAENPIASNDTEEGRAQNRRIEASIK